VVPAGLVVLGTPGQVAGAASAHPGGGPRPPAPEPVRVRELPLPPVTASTGTGACTRAVNPRGTGCIGQDVGLQSGDFLPDGRHVVATVRFAGAPAAPDPASV
jgi:hypothetical protein